MWLINIQRFIYISVVLFFDHVNSLTFGFSWKLGFHVLYWINYVVLFLFEIYHVYKQLAY